MRIRLECYTCSDHCCIKRPSAFSKRQLGGGVETEGAESASQELRPQGRQQQLIAWHLTQQQQRYQNRQLHNHSAEQTAETAGGAAGAAAEHRAAEQVAEQAVAEQAAEQPVVEQTAAKQAAEKAAEAAATEQASPGVLKFVVLNYF